jgi:hypothetical protein
MLEVKRNRSSLSFVGMLFRNAREGHGFSRATKTRQGMGFSP